ncbi:hypothetical protein D3C85_1334220 [compost metagenome]
MLASTWVAVASLARSYSISMDLTRLLPVWPVSSMVLSLVSSPLCTIIPTMPLALLMRYMALKLKSPTVVSITMV